MTNEVTEAALPRSGVTEAQVSITAADVLGITRQQRRAAVWLLILSIALAATVVMAVATGPVNISPTTVAGIIGNHVLGFPDEMPGAVSDGTIVWEVRLPRVVLGVCVGAGLAVCGMALQAMVRNILADPYLLGVNSGASSGAAAAILFGAGAGLGVHALPVSAFVGALIASLLVYGVARSGGRVTSVRLLLSGVAVGYALYALTSFLIFASDNAEGARSVMFWLLGSLALSGWGIPLGVVAFVTVLTILLLLSVGRALDALAVGDETARSLGIPPERLRIGLLVLVALCIGVLVAASGSIGFVGLVVPHMARRLVGATHRRALPVAALMGAILLVWADVAARTLLQPQEIPIGIVTALLGAPFLLILVRKLHSIP